MCYSKDTNILPHKGAVLQMDNSAVDEMFSGTEVSWTSSSHRVTAAVEKEKKMTTKTESTELESEIFTTSPYQALQMSKTVSVAVKTEWEVIAFYSDFIVAYVTRRIIHPWMVYYYSILFFLFLRGIWL